MKLVISKLEAYLLLEVLPDSLQVEESGGVQRTQDICVADAREL
jgi:hypothetical protein